MDKTELIGRIRDIYEQGGNILEFLRKGGDKRNDAESIMISYDYQAGTYTRFAQQNWSYLDEYTEAIVNILSGLNSFGSIMEVGVGEATLMNPLMQKIDPEGRLAKFGFDISWSRTRYAVQNSEAFGNRIKLFMADLFQIPLPDNSVDVVYTSHSLEPNGGFEKEALRELYRVAAQYIVLLEPDYESASSEGRERMLKHGYVRDLPFHALELGYDVTMHRPFDTFINPLNPTGLTLIRKVRQEELVKPDYVCPVTKTPLVRYGEAYFSEQTGLIYPIIAGIPCLISSASILGVHFSDFQK
jgi:ubiquinone/menaquinone biosynthesis C-methylase UbiE